MISVQEADAWIGRTAMDDTGEQIGRITQIWVDDASGQPEWASVKIAGREALVPLAGASAMGGGVQFSRSKEEIRSAPRIAQDGHLEAADKAHVASHYGVAASAPATAPPAAGWSEHPDEEADRMVAPAPPLAEDEAAPVAKKENRRFGRKSSPTDKPATRRFGRKASRSDQEPTDIAAQHDEVSVAG